MLLFLFIYLFIRKVESSDASSIKEQIITSETDSFPSFSRECNFETDKYMEFGDFSSVSPKSSHTYKKNQDPDLESLDFKAKQYESEIEVHQGKNCIIQDERVVAENVAVIIYLLFIKVKSFTRLCLT